MFISLEGIEGCGKTTQLEYLSNFLKEHGRSCVVTREPGGTAIGKKIRSILLDPASKGLVPAAELLLYMADRAQHIDSLIKPRLAEGKIVLCDRFMDSTTVYQGVARNIQSEPVQMINTFAVGNMVPDVTVVIDLDAEVGLERVRHRANDMPDRMEKENIEFYQKVRNGYLMLAKAMHERFIVVDGDLDRNSLEEVIWKELRQRVI